MATVKNTSGNYIITCDNGDGTVIINADLDVVGNITWVNNLYVDNAFITVAANNTGIVQDMGLIAQASSNTFAGLRYDTITSQWQISNNVSANGDPISAYRAIQSGTEVAPGGGNNAIQFNGNGDFSGSNNFSFDPTLNQVSLVDGYLVLGNVGNIPSATANAVAMFNGEVGPGGTGLYFTNQVNTDELISTTQAIVYSLIF
jgi:hypothetical protein